MNKIVKLFCSWAKPMALLFS